MPAIINSDSGVITGSAGLKIHGNSDGILEIQNNGVTSLVVANNYIRVPVGNTATRPSVASAGMLRFNNTSNVFEAFNGTGWASIASQFNISYLIVAGGGGGSNYGGGGAGGVLSSYASIDTNRTANITVGAGGSGGATNASNGSPSSFIIRNILTNLEDSVIATGGGRGGSGVTLGTPGGSGGGAGYGPGASVFGGSTLPGTFLGAGWFISGTVQGFAGGDGGVGAPTFTAGGGGGGGQTGGTGTPTVGGFGGNGALISWFTGAYGDPSPAGSWFAGGGGGGNFAAPGVAAVGGIGGGGRAGKAGTGALSGNVNTGGGGGGSGNTPAAGGSGGSGIVILSHSNVLGTFATTGSPNVTSTGGNVFYVFTQSGTINFGSRV